MNRLPASPPNEASENLSLTGGTERARLHPPTRTRISPTTRKSAKTDFSSRGTRPFPQLAGQAVDGKLISDLGALQTAVRVKVPALIAALLAKHKAPMWSSKIASPEKRPLPLSTWPD